MVKLLLSSLLTLCVGVTSISTVHADTSTNKTSGIKIEHTPPVAKELPIPGAPLTLKIRLKGTRDLSLSLRAFVTRDGRVTDYILNNAKFNQNEEIEYDLSFPAPLSTFSYQFALYTDKNPTSLDKVVTSKRFQVNRLCIPSISPAADELSPSLKSDEKLRAMVTQVKELERDDVNYQRVIALLNEIKQLVAVNE